MPSGFPDGLFRYELLEERPVGQGGFGQIWKAQDILFGRPVAIKTVNESLAWADDFRVRRAFIKEATAGARLGELSRHIVPVIDLGIVGKIPFFVMPWIEPAPGGSVDISDMIGRVSLAKAKVVLFQAADAVAVAHENGIVHSDISPWNILYAPSHNIYQVADFGLLKITENRLLTAGSGSLLRGGRLDFQPPEVRDDISNLGYSADVYALAVTLRVLIEGHRCLRHRGGRPFPTPGVVRVQHEQRDAPDKVRQLLKRFIDDHSTNDTVADFVAMLGRIPQ
jgi:serine/threonine protein kinase